MRRASSLRRAAAAATWSHFEPALSCTAATCSQKGAGRTSRTPQERAQGQLRGFCASAVSKPLEPAQTPEQTPTLYTGPLALTLKRVKLLSLASLVVTTLGAPTLVHLSSPESVSEAAKLALSGTVIAFGCFTTGLLSFFSSPYVLRLALAADGACTVTTLNLLAKPTTVVLHVSEFREPQTVRPLATFTARGKVFFLDGHVANEELLAALGLKKTEVAPPGSESFDDEEEDDLDRRAEQSKGAKRP